MKKINQIKRFIWPVTFFIAFTLPIAGANSGTIFGGVLAGIDGLLLGGLAIMASAAFVGVDSDD